jgi:thiol-disulfide isomerase/thioredoxin
MNTRSRTFLIAAAVAVVLLAIVAVALAGGGDDDDSAVSTGAGGQTIREYQAVDITGGALPEFVSTSNDIAVGTPAPQLIGHNFDGTPVHIQNDGKPKLVLFLAHWCPHCQKEVPVVKQWLTDGGGEGIEVYAVSTNATSDRPNWPASTWLRNEGWPAPVLVDDKQSTAAERFGLTSFPYLVFVDAEGNVALRASGEIPAEQLTTFADAVR